MSGLVKVTLTGVVALGFAGAPATMAFAAPGTHCDAYSTTCVQGEKFHKPPVLPQQNSQLPFTGADIAAMAATSVIALGAGSALVVAGRRRRSSFA